MAEKKKEVKNNINGIKKASTSKSSSIKATATKKSNNIKDETISSKNSSKKTTTMKKSIDKESKLDNKESRKETVTKQVKTIEINQRQLVIGIVIIVLILSLCLICFLGSDATSSKYIKTSNNGSLESSGDSILEQATKEAGEINDDVRTAPVSISVSEYLDLYNSDGLSIVLLSKESCSYCQIAIPIIENIIYEKGININHIDVGNMNSDDTSKLIGSDDYFSEGYGTPLLLLVGNGEIKDKIEGLSTKSSYMEFFTKYGFME